MKNDPADVRRAFEYARDIGVPTIVCSPEPESMKILDAMVKEFDIKIAIHNHGPEDKKFPSPYDVWTAVQPYDKRVGLCIDVGHTARAKVDPAEAIRKCRERLYDCHLKDIDSTAPDGKTIEGGRGCSTSSRSSAPARRPLSVPGQLRVREGRERSRPWTLRDHRVRQGNPGRARLIR